MTTDNYTKLASLLDQQDRVKRLECEGSILIGLRGKIEAAHDLGLIDFEEWCELDDRLLHNEQT